MKNTIERRIAAVVIATGVSSVVTQLLVIREFLSQFNGNEFVVALILFNWLILGGAGTLLANKAGRNPGPEKLAMVTLGLAALSPLELYAVRELRDVLFLHGASLGFFPTFSYTFFTIVPYCLLLGFALPYSLRTASRLIPGYPGIRIYITDNIGDAAGGALFSFVLILFFSPFQAIAAAQLLLLGAAVFLMPPQQRLRPAFLGSLACCLALLGFGIWMERPSLAPAEGELAYYEESRYGRIAVHREKGQHTLFLDGVPLFSSETVALAEETVHYPLSQLQAVDRVLVISAEAGIMKEIEKYRPERVDYVEIDPRLTRVQFEFGLIQKIKGLDVIHQDGRAFLNRTERRYDAILLTLPEPDTFQLNRFFTQRFFRLAKDHLAPGGILSFAAEGIDTYLSRLQQRKLSSLYRTAEKSFQHIRLLPGERTYFLCADFPVNPDIPGLLKEKGILTQYISGYFYGNMPNTRIQRINAEILEDAPINRDYSPIMIRIMFSEWFSRYASSPAFFTLLILALCAVYFLVITREEFVLFSTGCMVMGSETLVIFAFQIFFGYIYYQIGLIVTVFLAGLLPGALFGERLRKKGRRVLLATDALLILLLMSFIASVYLVGDRMPHGSFLVFGLAVSAACGCQFPVALHLRGSSQKAAIQSFSADLIGAAAGTLVTSVVLIPYAGILWTALALAGIKAASFYVLRTGHDIHIAT